MRQPDLESSLGFVNFSCVTLQNSLTSLSVGSLTLKTKPKEPSRKAVIIEER